MSDLIRRMDAVQACQVGPSDEWSRSTKSGYNQAATDCAMNILRVPAVQPGKEVMPDATRKVCDHDTAPASTDDAGGGAEKMALCDAIRTGMGALRVTYVEPDQMREDRDERAGLAREDDK